MLDTKTIPSSERWEGDRGAWAAFWRLIFWSVRNAGPKS
jgi:hypothetical protein